MPRSKEEIENQIITAKEAEPTLSTLNSVSQTALWRSFVKLSAFIINIFEQLFDVFRSEVNQIVEENRVGKTSWYAKKVKEFQLGDIVNENAEYNKLDVTKQIITRVSVREIEVDNRKRLLIKVAKGEPPEKLSTTEFPQLKQYVERFKFAGVWVDYISQNADDISANIKVYYKDLDEATVKSNVESKINEFLNSIDFDGVFTKSKFIPFVESAVGVVAIEINSVTATPEAEASTVIDQFYVSKSGYFKYNVSSVINMQLYEV
ncbi:hypothetical protein AD998_01700 [bacterium 336/3]|nr:hypothetical protein AD998_01700 [bacterium 336/3]